LRALARPGEVPLSFAQRRLWFLNRLEGESAGDHGATYTIPLAVRLTGELDRGALEGALGDLVERHESLRTIFPERLGEARQELWSAAGAGPRLVVREVGAAELSGAMAAAVGAGFDLSRDLPLRAHLFALSPAAAGSAAEHVLLLLLHHIAADGWSLAPLARDLGRFYRGRCGGGGAGGSWGPGAYFHHTPWGHAGFGVGGDPPSGISRPPTFWAGRGSWGPQHAGVPSDHGRPAVASHRGGSVGIAVDAELHRGLLELSRGSGASLFMLLQAALAALLTRLGAGEDIPIGSPIAGRGDSALDDLVGFFVNTLVLRTDTSGNPSVRELLGRVRAGNLLAYGHQDLPFERLVEVLNPARSLSRHPLFQV